MPSTDKTSLDRLQDALGHRFASTDLLRAALTHPSVQDARKNETGYERLEFLGDRVLGLIVAEMLLNAYPEEAEGDLAKRHAAAVQRAALADIATQLKLGDYLYLSPGEHKSGGRSNRAILADALEALIAALYLDGGIDTAKKFIETNWAAQIDRVAPPQDAKTTLQEWVQGNGLDLPVYEIVEQSGPQHAPMFEMSVTITGFAPVTARAKSKRKAEKLAAQRMMEQIEKETS